MKQVENILNEVAKESGFDNWEQYFNCFQTTEPGRRVINKGIRKAVTKALFLSDVMLSCPSCGKDVTVHNGLGDFICSHCYHSWRHESQRMVLCTVWDYEAPNYQFTITFNTRTNVEFTTEPQMGYSTC